MVDIAFLSVVDILHRVTGPRLHHAEAKGEHVFLVGVEVEVEVSFFKVGVHRWRLIKLVSSDESVLLDLLDPVFVLGVFGSVNQL